MGAEAAEYATALMLVSALVFPTLARSDARSATLTSLLAQLVLDDKVALDDPVQKFLPADVTLPTRDQKAITLGNLAIQNSGLPRMPTNFTPADSSNPYAHYSVQQMYDFLSGYTLTRDPGEQFEYSNLGVGLLGHALALSEGMTCEQLQRERI